MLMEDYESADRLLGIAEHFIYRKILSPFDRIHTFCGNFLSFLREGITKDSELKSDFKPTNELPFEVGRFLVKNKKLTNASDDFEACKELCYYYRQSDLHKLLINLQNGIQDNNIDAITATRSELDNTLDNLWTESDSIRRKINIAEAMIPVSVGVIGEIAGRAISSNAHLGILASFGVLAVDRILSSKKGTISELLAKWRMQDYLVGIFDFKKKIPKS